MKNFVYFKWRIKLSIYNFISADSAQTPSPLCRRA